MIFDNILLPFTSKGEFLNQFAYNDNLKSQADAVWRQLDGLTPWLLLGMAALSIGFATYYYGAYNNQPGRHYKPMYWAIFGGNSIAVTLAFTFIAEWFVIKTNLHTGIWSYYIYAALYNAIYCALVYFITSVVWCNWVPTNAYRYFKFKR